MDSLTIEQKEQKAAEGKKKKSTFRITSIIDPVKNDDDEDDDKENDEDETEEKTTASRFRVIKSQTPNPRTFFSGRWKVREMYLMELSNHKEAGKEPPQTSRGTSGTSNDSTGDNNRCATPQSSSSLSFTEEPSVPTFSIPKLDTSHLESFENQVSNHLKKSKEEMVALHLLSSSINMKYEKLKEEHEKIRRENHSLKEEIRRLRSR